MPPDALDSHIEWARAELATQFKDAALVTRATGPKVFDPATGQYTAPTATVYDGDTPGDGGRCKIRPVARQGTDIEAGEGQVRQADYEAKFPADTDVAKGDHVLVTSCTWDAGMVGRRFRVADAWFDSWQVGRVTTLTTDGTDGEES